MTTEVLEQTQADTPAATEEQNLPPQAEETLTTPEIETPVQQPLTLAELNAKAETEGLTAEEYRQQAQLQRAENDRRQNEARYNAQIEAQQKAYLDNLGKARANRDAELKALRDAEITASIRDQRPFSTKLVDDQNALVLERYDREVENIVLEPQRAILREVVGTLLEPGGITPRTRSTLQSYDLMQLVKAGLDAAYALGQNIGPGADKVVLTKAEHQRLLQQVGDEVKRATGLGAGSTTKGSPAQVAQELTLDFALKGDIRELKALRDRQKANGG